MTSAVREALRRSVGAAIFCLLSGVYFTRLEEVEFHGDESQWISSSYALEAIESGNVWSRVWDESYQTLTMGPLTRYVIGLGRQAGGYDARSLNHPWDFGLSDKQNTQYGNMPGSNLLWWARLPMAILSVVSILIWWHLASRSAGRTAGWVVVLLFTVNPFFLTALRRAMSEAPLLAGVALAALCAHRAILSWGRAANGATDTVRPLMRSLIWWALAGLWCGAAGAAKMNGLAGVAAVLALCVLAPIAAPGGISAMRRATFVATASALLTASATIAFVAPNPYLYPDGPARTLKLFRFRVEEMGRQQAMFPKQAIRGAGMRVNVLFNRILGNYSAMRFTGGAVLSLVLTVLGLASVIISGWRWVRGAGGAGASAVLLLFAIATATPSLTTPLDWSRFYLLPITYTTVFSAIGITLVVNGAGAQILRLWAPHARTDQAITGGGRPLAEERQEH